HVVAAEKARGAGFQQGAAGDGPAGQQVDFAAQRGAVGGIDAVTAAAADGGAGEVARSAGGVIPKIAAPIERLQVDLEVERELGVWFRGEGKTQVAGVLQAGQVHRPIEQMVRRKKILK